VKRIGFIFPCETIETQSFERLVKPILQEHLPSTETLLAILEQSAVDSCFSVYLAYSSLII